MLRSHLLAITVIAGLLTTLGLVTPASADTGDLRPNATSALDWLAAQTLPDGTLTSTYAEPMPDVGLTLDAALAAMAGGSTRAQINKWIDAAAPHIKVVSSDKGRVAKALVTLSAAGRSTTSYGGINPQDIVRKAVGTNGHIEGTNAFGQSFAMIGMARTGALPSPAVDFLIDQQCSSGAFPMNFGTNADTHCDASGKAHDPDGTAMAIMALRAAQAKGISKATAPLNKAVTWLKSQQESDGSYRGAVPYTSTKNINSSGLVAAALADQDNKVVGRIGAWAATMQLSTGTHAGAVAYDAHTLNRSITPVTKGTWVRATTQAILAFAPVDFYRMIPRYQRTAPYTLAGNHTLNGRQWRTTCQPYSQTERCRTEIWATTVVIENGRFVRKNDWVFNNLTYLPYMTEASWQGNPLAMHNMTGFTSGGRQWRTECNTAQTGQGACRSYLLSTVYIATPRSGGGYSFRQEQDWVFNNIVMFGTPVWR